MRRDGFWAQILIGFLERHFLPRAERFGWTPDQVTWLGVFLAAASGIAFFFSAFWGGVFLALAGVCDVADGLLAEHAGRTTKAGAFLDSVLDRYGEIFVFAGLWGHLVHRGMEAQAASLLVIGALGGSLMVSYARARGEGLGITCASGRFQRPERLLLLIAGAILDPLFSFSLLTVAVVVVAVGANLTAISRLFAIRRQLAAADDR